MIEWKKYNERYSVSSEGEIRNDFTGYILKGSPNRKGYLLVEVGVSREKRDCRATHSIVAEKFLGPRPEGYQINHIDGSKRNNRASNLEYVTPSENVMHSIRMGLTKYLTPDKVKSILEMHKEGFSKREISEKLGVSVKNIGPILTGKNYSEFTGIEFRKSSREEVSLKRSKLTSEDIGEIRICLRAKLTSQSAIAKIFNISESIISEIKTNKIWIKQGDIL